MTIRAAGPTSGLDYRLGTEVGSGSINESGTDMIRLYGTAKSRATYCLWLLEELNVTYEHVPTAFDGDDLTKPEYLAINPNAKIPALQDGNVTLFESMAINLYLVQKYESSLWPNSLGDQALVLQWTIWALTEVDAPLVALFRENIRPPEQTRHEVIKEEANEKLARSLGVLNRHLKDRTYLLGDRFTLADLNAAGVLSFASVFSYEIKDCSEIDTWLKICCERPARKTVTRMAESA